MRAMGKSDADILRDVAALVVRRRLDGRTFPTVADRTQGRQGRDAPDVVREVARLIRPRI